MAQLNPYLNFENNCREAMNFYKECLGGELYLQTVSESPEMAAQMPTEFKDHILHSSLTSGNITFMGSDLCRSGRMEGNTVHLCIHCDTQDELNSFFSSLAAGGSVTEPISDMPWGAKYGAVTDKFGKHWMFNFQQS